MQENTLSGKVALVTGAGSGLGEATARAFADAGCAVGWVDINGEAAQRISHDLDTQDIKNRAIQCDVSDAKSVFRTVALVVAQVGKLDIVVNCAAIDHTLSVDEMTIDQWDQVINVNLRVPFLFHTAVLPLLRRH